MGLLKIFFDLFRNWFNDLCFYRVSKFTYIYEILFKHPDSDQVYISGYRFNPLTKKFLPGTYSSFPYSFDLHTKSKACVFEAKEVLCVGSDLFSCGPRVRSLNFAKVPHEVVLSSAIYASIRRFRKYNRSDTVVKGGQCYERYPWLEFEKHISIKPLKI